MSLIELKGIGKIYVSDNNVSVGIRNVDLAFDRGEFVAVTGKSGSGKSTLLNVISGMDTYEEGELFINGEPTSHYLQKDWEEYRKNYISFIFQDYNILESFTVLQNVELALMNIDDTKKRREKALELIKRVGLEKHIHHKGSKLSGGQKQRTVIARALAKDSPIILADEPTGNLDSETSKEIISLLREVSKDKLVIVVTHNFEQVEEYATRHIRVFNGEIEADHVISSPFPVCDAKTDAKENVSKARFPSLKNGIILGKVRFAATPKLSLFMFLLFTVTTLIMAIITSESSDAEILFKDETIFRHTEGRAVVVRADGGVITDEDVKKVSERFGKKVVKIDNLYDASIYGIDYYYSGMAERLLNEYPDGRYPDYYYDYEFYHTAFYYDFNFEPIGKSTGVDEGRLPEKDNEVALRIPISEKPGLTRNGFEEFEIILFDNVIYTVTGVDFFYDNTKNGAIILTEDGFTLASSLYYAYNNRASVYSDKACVEVLYSWDIEKNGYYSDSDTVMIQCSTGRRIINKEIDGKRIKEYDFKKDMKRIISGDTNVIVVSPYIITDFVYNDVFPEMYTQMSVFFGDDGDAHSAEEEFHEMGYRAVCTDEVRKPEIYETILNIFVFGWLVVMWVLGVVFAAMLLRLCSSHAMNSVKGDIAIMRSMGIPTKVIKISVYVQNLLALIPSFILSAVIITVVYMLPKTNGLFTFMHFADYLLIAVIVIAIAIRLSVKYVEKMFGESVKKTLKGGVRV